MTQQMGKPGTNKAIWELESTHPEKADQLRTALGEVLDPELGLSVVALGLIRNARIQDDSLIIKMLLTTPFCPYGPALIEMVRQKATEVMGVEAAIDLSMEMWDFSMMEEGADLEWGLY